jgi:hypothetical protein
LQVDEKEKMELFEKLGAASGIKGTALNGESFFKVRLLSSFSPPLEKRD